MNKEGRDFLFDACSVGKEWAGQFRTLADAWEACGNAEWMRWALDQLGEDVSRYRRMSAPELRRFGNPFVKRLHCFFCREFLSDDEKRDSEIVGTLPRCREHLREVGLEAA